MSSFLTMTEVVNPNRESLLCFQCPNESLSTTQVRGKWFFRVNFFIPNFQVRSLVWSLITQHIFIWLIPRVQQLLKSFQCLLCQSTPLPWNLHDYKPQTKKKLCPVKIQILLICMKYFRNYKLCWFILHFQSPYSSLVIPQLNSIHILHFQYLILKLSEHYLRLVSSFWKLRTSLNITFNSLHLRLATSSNW